MVGAEDNAVALTQVNSDVSMAGAIQFARPTCDEVLDCYGSAQICQTPLELLSHFYPQVTFRLLVVLTDLTK